ncbi:hypothetical protein BR63_11275 [Thermanaerosceptrum fracticalcis]|uniref:DnaD domain protein n=1 Tax=Thermanaerosceptrum fracticalcis TaxID=1712410 RepID=A0A7G6E435_THEFR|nr:hypothetical protein [Thermanaerosceptrum fracticalcis]QNB46839.1 hypothetical protein BR63_11275 [Thermanaerosceptrum fracticalcis]
MYTKVESRFWQDEKMRTISDDARYLMLYFLTSPHRNIMGFYFLPTPYACFDLGWDEKRFQKGLEELLQTGRVKYDACTHVVLVQNYLKHNPLENPNQVKSAIERLEEMPQTPLFQDFLAVVEQCKKTFIQPLRERLRERLRQPVTVTVTGAVTGDINTHICASACADARDSESNGDFGDERAAGQDPDGSVEAEQVTATSGEQRAKTSKPRPPFKSKKQESLFDQFWQAYPKKKAKGQAERAWAKLQPDEQLVETMLTAIERAKKSEEWRKENGRYIPYPATWLNGKRWEDEYMSSGGGYREYRDEWGID